jgi:heme exporter protein D
MNKHTFFLGAVLLALIALITHSVARGFLEDAMHRKAARIAQAQKQQTDYTPDSRALQSSRRYNILTIVGVVLTASSAVSMVAEPGAVVVTKGHTTWET